VNSSVVMGQKLGVHNKTGCLPPQLCKQFTAAEQSELRDMYEKILQYRLGSISEDELTNLFPGILEEGVITGEVYDKEKLDVFLENLSFEDFVNTVSSHYADASAGAFVAETLSTERKMDIDANDIDLVSIFKYYDNDDNGTVDLDEVRNALRDLYRVSQRCFEGYRSWVDEDLSEEIISEQIQRIKAKAKQVDDNTDADATPSILQKASAAHKKEIRLDFAEFSTMTNEFVRLSTLSMVELKHREKHLIDEGQHQDPD